MIIDTAKKRAEYFSRPEAHEMIRYLVPELSGSQLSHQDFSHAVSSDRVRAATGKGTIDSLFENSNHDATIRTVEDSTSEQLILLPAQYSIRGSAHDILAYSSRSLVKLDSRVLSQYVLGKAQDRLSLKKKEGLDWRFSRVLPAEFERRHEEGLFGRHLAGISWWGVGNNQRRIMSLYRSLQGAEIKAFQDFAFFRLRHARASALKNRKGRFKDLSQEEINARLDKIESYTKYLEKQGISPLLQKLDVSFDDLIEEAGRPFAQYTGQSFRVPNSKGDGFYSVRFTHIPANLPVGREWELRGSCDCADANFRRDRRHSTIGKGQDEDYRCKHQEAALHAVRKLGSRYGYEMEFPGIFPLKPLIDVADKLRYNTLVVDGTSKRKLSATEIDNVLMKTLVARGPEKYITCDPKEISGDLRLEYVKIR